MNNLATALSTVIIYALTIIFILIVIALALCMAVITIPIYVIIGVGLFIKNTLDRNKNVATVACSKS